MANDVTYTSGPLDEAEIEMMARDLRPIEREDVLRTFPSVEDAIQSCCQVSDYLRVIRFHGQPISVYGAVHDRETGYGVPWMLTTELRSFAHPVRVLRVGRELMAEMISLFPVMHNIVPIEDVEACSLLQGLGFEVLDSVVQSGGYDYRPFWYGRAA